MNGTFNFLTENKEFNKQNNNSQNGFSQKDDEKILDEVTFDIYKHQVETGDTSGNNTHETDKITTEELIFQGVDWKNIIEKTKEQKLEQEKKSLGLKEERAKLIEELNKKENKEEENETYDNTEEDETQENDEIKQLENRIDGNNEELHELTQEIRELKTYNEDCNKYTETLENEKGDLEKRCEELESVNKKLEDVNKELLEKNIESEKVVEILSNENTLTFEFCEMKKDVEKYKANIAELIVEIKNLEDEKDKLKMECDSLKIENNELIRNNEDYVNDFTISSIQNSNLVEMNTNLESENKSLYDKISLLESNMNNQEELKQHDEKTLLPVNLQSKFTNLENKNTELVNFLEQTKEQLDKKNMELFTITKEVEEIVKIKEEKLKGIENKFVNTPINFEAQHNEYKDVLNTTINEKKKLMDNLEVIANHCKDQKQLITDQIHSLKTRDNEIMSLRQMNDYLIQQMNELVKLTEEKLIEYILYCKGSNEKEKDNVINNGVVVKQKQKIPISRIHWSSIPLKIYIGGNVFQIDNPRLSEEREINGETITFVQDEVDFIKLKKTENIFDRLCVIDLTYCKGNTIDIHTPNGVLLCQSIRGINGSIFKLEYGLGKNENILYKNASLYVSFIQTYVENDNKFIFNCDYMPPQCNELTTIVYRVIIPADYSKDVYYWNYQNRKELFRYSDYCHIPVYFPIPVLKRKMYNIFYYIDPYGNNYQFIRLLLRLNKTGLIQY